MALNMYGWNGNQTEISVQIKPVLQDRNVNPEEMAHFVRNFAGWLQVEYRVGGDLMLLKRLLAANYPVLIEATTELDPNDALGPTDDLWAAHYLLLTGYDEAGQTFTAQDAYRGPDKKVAYSQVEAEWRAFNHLYMLVFLPSEADEVKGILGEDWDADQNRLRSLEATQAAVADTSADAFDWFNLGSNLTYFERYEEAAQAYDRAREIGLPLRMFRYQFGPFLSYFHSDRNEDLLLLTDYARGVTEMSEEAWLWYGWGLYRDGEIDQAAAAWRKALSINGAPYVDARLALQTIGQ
jgi:tetratricopeptide (TPR) repeat protein